MGAWAWPVNVATCGQPLDQIGSGIIRVDGWATQRIASGLFRGGRFDEPQTHELRVRILSAWMDFEATVSWDNLGFRCVYVP
jgi:hypothetical protein